MMPRRLPALLATLLAVAVPSSSVFAQPAGPGRAEVVATEGGVAVLAAADVGVERCFDDWVVDQGGIEQGPNLRPDGGTLFLARGVAEVTVQRGPQWLAARNAAFTRAELEARKALADYIGVELRSERSSRTFHNGGDESAPSARPAAEQISNVERLSTLTGLTLDNAIRQFSPGWTGGNVSEEQRRQQAARLQVETRERIAARASIFAAGAFTAVQCEGQNTDGKYAVVVGMLWSGRLQAVAEAMTGTIPSMPPEAPRPSLAAQFTQRTREAPDWLSVTEGTRVWTNERGEKVVVGFGAVSGSSLASVDEGRARVRALAAIQRFVGERIEARDTAASEFTSRESLAGEMSSFDSSAFEQRVEAKAKDMTLRGVSTVRNWRGRHPWAEVPMQVVVLAWTPSGAAGAEALGREMRDGSAAAARGNLPDRSNPTAASTRRGASSSAADF